MYKGCQLTFILFFFSFANSAFSQLNVQTLRAGFKVIHGVDRSRIYKPGTDTGDYLHFRPVDIDVWYPVNAGSEGTKIPFRNFLGLLEARAGYYTASDTFQGITGQVAASFCDIFKCSDTAKLLGTSTNTYANQALAEARLPLIIYMASYNSMCYENILLFEQLAESGFIVASISSIGQFPGDMTMKFEDMMEQVNDAEFAIKLLSTEADTSRIGVIGYSWGGLTGVMLAGKIAADCVVSLDGSEFHHYAGPKQENKDFDGIINSNEFKKMKITMPYLRLESEGAGKGLSRVYDFSQKLYNEKTILTVKSADHQDFSCLPNLVRTSGNCKTNSVYNTITRLTQAFILDQFSSQNSFSDLLKNELNKSVKRK